MNTRRKAFTIVELLVVVMIIALIGGVVIPEICNRIYSNKSQNAFGNISKIGLNKARGLYAKDYIEWGVGKKLFTQEEVYVEEEAYLTYTTMSALIKIPYEGYESLSEEEKRVLTAAVDRRWLRREEVESRQAGYLEKCKLELRKNIEELQEEETLLEARDFSIP